MPNHSPEHMQRITSASAAQRRAEKIARLIENAPPLTPDQRDRLALLLRGAGVTS